MSKHDSKNSDVLVTILSWNNYEDTKDCIDSVLNQDYGRFDILLIDNGSLDESVRKLNCDFPEIYVNRNDSNYGFARGINKGIKKLKSEYDYILVLNNDISFPNHNTITNLVHTIKDNKDAGIVSPLIYNKGNLGEPWFKHGSIDRAAGDAFHSEPQRGDFINNKLIENEYIPLACALIPVKVLNYVGMIPEGYFLYYEDAEFGIKLRDLGYKLITDTDSYVTHKKMTSTGGQFGSIFSYYRARNRLIFGSRHCNSNTFYILFFIWSMKAVGDRFIHLKFKSILAFLLGIFDAMRGRRGKGPYP